MKHIFTLFVVISLTTFLTGFAQLIVKDQDATPHTLLKVTDEGSGGAIFLPTIFSVGETGGKLYNLAGKLYWNTRPLSVIGATAINDLTDAKYDDYSLFLGEGAGAVDDGQNYNTAIGKNTLKANTSGILNTAIGYYTLQLNDIGSYNVANGTETLYNNSSGSYNTANGSKALYSNETGGRNIASGYYALYKNRSGSYNTASGYYALYENVSGSDNTAVGSSAGTTISGISNSTAIGNGAKATSGNQVRIGNSFVTSIGGYAAWSNLSDGRYKQNVLEDVKGIDFIMGLRPITYNLNVELLANKLKENITIDQDGIKSVKELSPEAIASRSKKASVRQSGFIAQEVEELANKLGYNFSGIEVPENDESLYSLRYAEFVVPIVKAMQEQQKLIMELRKELDELKNK